MTTQRIALDINTQTLDDLINKLKQVSGASGNTSNEIGKILDVLLKIKNVSDTGAKVSVAELQKFNSILSVAQNKIALFADDKALKANNDSWKDLTDQVQKLTEKLDEAKTKSASLNEELKKKKDAYETTTSKSYADYDKTHDKVLSGMSNSDIFNTSRRKANSGENADENRLIEQAKKAVSRKQQADALVTKEFKDIQEQANSNDTVIKNYTTDLNNCNKALNKLVPPELMTQLNALGKNTELSNIATQVEKTGKAAEEAGQKFAFITDQSKITENAFGGLTKQLISTTLVFRAVKTVLREAVNTIKEMDASITAMTVVTGKSREEVQGLVNDFKNIAQATSSTLTEVASLTTEYVRQGRSIQDAEKLATETAKAAKIAGISVGDSITYMTSAINGFNLAATDATKVSDVFAKLAAVSATNYEQLAVALSKVSAQASQAGMSMEYTTALLAKGIETTQEAPTSIGTALKTIIARFRELSDYGSTLEDGMNVNQVEEALSAVGIKLRDSTGSFRNLEDVLNELGPKWDDLSSMQRQAIAQAAAGTRQQSRFLAIMQNWDRTMELINDAQDSAGASISQYSKYAEGMTASISRLQTAWQNFTLSLTNNQLIIGAINTVQTILNTLNGFAPVIKTIGIAFLAILAIDEAGKKIAELKAQKLAEQQATEAQMNSQQLIMYKAATLNQKQFEAFYKDKVTSEYNSAVAAENEHYAAQKKLVLNLQDLKVTAQKIALSKDSTEAEKLAAKAQIAALDTQIASYSTIDAEHEANLATLKKNYDLEVKGASKYKEILKTNSLASIANSNSLIDIIKHVGTLSKSSGGLKEAWGAIKKRIAGSWKGMASMAIKATLVAAVVADILLIAKQISDIIHADQVALTKISSDYAAIGETKNKKSSIKSDVEDLAALDAKAVKTTEDLQKMDELKQNLNDKGIKGNTTAEIIKNSTDAMGDLDKTVQDNMTDALTNAFEASIYKGIDIFKKSDFKAVFADTMNMKNTADTSTEKGKAQSKTYKNVVSNMDYTKIGQAAQNDSDQVRNTWKKIGAGYGGVALGGGAGAVAGALGVAGAVALAGNVVPVVGTAIGAAVGAVIAGTAAAIAWVKKVNGNLAKEEAARAQEIMQKAGDQINTFSAQYAEQEDRSIGERYNTYKNFISNIENSTDAVDQTVTGALKTSFDYYEVLRKANISAEDLTDLQRGLNSEDGFAISSDSMETILKQMSQLGTDAATKFVTAWKKKINAAKSDVAGTITNSDIASSLYLELSGINGDAEKKILQTNNKNLTDSQASSIVSQNNDYVNSQQEYEKEAQAEADKIGAIKKEFDNNKNDADKERIAKAAGYESAFKYQEALNQQYDTASKKVQEYKDNVKSLQESLLSIISPYDDLLSLSQGLTSLSSQNKNLQEFSSALKSGTTTIEQWTEAATKYADILSSDEFQKAFESGNADKMSAILSSGATVTAQLQKQTEQIDAFKQKTELKYEVDKADIQKKIDEANKEGNTKLADDYKKGLISLDKEFKANNTALEAYKRTQLMFTDAQLKSLNATKKLTAAEKKIKNGDLSGYKEKAALLQDDLTKAQTDLATYLDYNDQSNSTGEKYSQIYEEVISGNTAMYDKLSDTEKTYFKVFYNNMEDYSQDIQDAQDKISDNASAELEATISLQNEMVDAVKRKLQEENKATKDALDKRKQLYQDYFDALEQEENTDDYEKKRQAYENTIAKLSTATDSASLQKLKEAQSSLADLNKDQRSTERQNREDAVMDTLDDEGDKLDELYNKAIENTNALYNTFIALSDKARIELLRQANNYYKLTDAEREQFDKKYGTFNANGNIIAGTETGSITGLKYSNGASGNGQNVDLGPLNIPTDTSGKGSGSLADGAGSAGTNTGNKQVNTTPTTPVTQSIVNNNTTTTSNSMNFGDVNFNMIDKTFASSADAAKLVLDVFVQFAKQRGITLDTNNK